MVGWVDHLLLKARRNITSLMWLLGTHHNGKTVFLSQVKMASAHHVNTISIGCTPWQPTLHNWNTHGVEGGGEEGGREGAGRERTFFLLVRLKLGGTQTWPRYLNWVGWELQCLFLGSLRLPGFDEASWCALEQRFNQSQDSCIAHVLRLPDIKIIIVESSLYCSLNRKTGGTFLGPKGVWVLTSGGAGRMKGVNTECQSA